LPTARLLISIAQQSFSRLVGFPPLSRHGAHAPVLGGMRLVFSGLLVVENLSQRSSGLWGETA
jgi:hypothetical protein